jgi:hypothetical protein
LLKELSRHEVREMLSREPSLEELFLSLYGDPNKADTPVAD